MMNDFMPEFFEDYILKFAVDGEFYLELIAVDN